MVLSYAARAMVSVLLAVPPARSRWC